MDGRADTPESQTADWGAFGRPIFDNPEARALSRVGVIDVGSNSVRLVVFDGAARSPAYFYNEKVMCGLGRDMGETGHLHPEGRARALSAIKRFVALADGMGIPPLTAVATAAVRSATDGTDFCAQVLEETGLDLYVIDGEEEARLSAQGVLLGWPDAQGLVCDIGGSSMELATVDGGDVGARVSSPLGPLRLTGNKNKRRDQIDHWLDKMAETIKPHRRLYLVGGSWRAVARLDMVRRDYPMAVLHDYQMTPRSIRQTLDWVKAHDLDELRHMAGLSSARISLVPLAGEVLRRLMNRFEIKQVTTSSYGIREGMLYEQMSRDLRMRNPLIEACRYDEARNARLPGFGRTLYKFILPIFSTTRMPKHLIKAACLLHDVSWRAHPDYRAEVCFDNTTRGNLGGIDHEGRIFLGLALLHRYRNARPGNRIEPLLGLIGPKMTKQAEILGKAMRFGAMFSVAAPERLGTLRHRPKRHELELTLPPRSAALYGEVAAARFNSLAQALDAEQIVKFTK
ncbi:Ppx/GppA family phosphatase [Actibacterium sp. 188UL27-1]|uniref:Ppx/GppA family phosphatase n=1 Tax=Actibacterium sp. 188UL27-1 TaxID=2786961 RepID=UPI0019596EBC|nr:Ppx/GppA family phosphatase [Actibacterium sp. 188UL27-1]MBM7069554.1 Ppx/GppA family phosphatase [Actibacterium sp. 188UL27-1]